MEPRGGDIRTSLGSTEPELDDELAEDATTAEQAVPWLIGVILLLAGMVIVLLALIFAGDASLGGGSGATPSPERRCIRPGGSGEPSAGTEPDAAVEPGALAEHIGRAVLDPGAGTAVRRPRDGLPGPIGGPRADLPAASRLHRRGRPRRW